MSSTAGNDETKIDAVVRAIVTTAKRLRIRRPTRFIWCEWFRVTMGILTLGLMRGLSALTLLSAASIAALIALITLGIRWLEHRVPGT